MIPVTYPRLEKNGKYTHKRSELAFKNQPADTTELKDVDRVELLIEGYEKLEKDAVVVIGDEVFSRLRKTLRLLNEEYDGPEKEDKEVVEYLKDRKFELWFGLLSAN